MMQTLGYVVPSEPHTGFIIIEQDDGHVQVGWLLIILQVEYGKLLQFVLAHVFGTSVVYELISGKRTFNYYQ